MVDFVPPKTPMIGAALDYDFFNSYYNSIMTLSKSVPEFWLDTSNDDNNNDAADMGAARIKIVAGRFKIKDNLKKAGEHKWRIPLPAAFNEDRGKSDKFDPIIVATAENKERKNGDPVAMVLQDVDETGFTVTVYEPDASKKDAKILNINTINWIAIGIGGDS